MNFTAEVAALTEGFRRGYWYLAGPLNRVSIATNLADGYGRFTKHDDTFVARKRDLLAVM